MQRTIYSLLITLFAGIAIFSACEQPAEQPVSASVSVAEAMAGSDTSGYARAVQVREFHFPQDHGPHPEFKTEWWYYTGNLRDGKGRRFGFQFTIFRTALSPRLPERSSDWASNQLYMGHFAVSDVAGGEHYAFERFSRDARGLAGAQAEPFRVWLEDWTAEAAGSVNDLEMPRTRLYAAEEGIVLDLILRNTKPPALQGRQGLSQKGPEPGNASYYYSFTRIEAAGNLRLGEKTFAVEGLAWMDREWSTSALGAEQVGWDWFSLQLSDGSELMYYQLRKRDGSADRFSKGLLHHADGTGEVITREEVALEVLDTWDSPLGGRYPARWRLSLPGKNLSLEVTPLIADQEMNLSVRYWEGTVDVRGEIGEKPVNGSGYVELTGYGEK